jgi:hypothetical protein
VRCYQQLQCIVNRVVPVRHSVMMLLHFLGSTNLSIYAGSKRWVESSSVTAAKPQVVIVVWIWPADPQRVMEDCGWQ